MKIICSLLTIFLFVAAKLYAQPGASGGGLTITNIYNEKGDKINIYSDSSMKIRSFNLRNDSLIKETFMFQDLSMRKRALASQNSYQNSFVLALGAPYFSERKTNETYNEFGQRLLIIYRTDTMLMDIYGVISANGIGRKDRMDSLFFKKGHYQFSLKTKINQTSNNVWSENLKLIENGLTPYTIPKLSELGFITYDKHIDTSFCYIKTCPNRFL